VDRSRQTVLRRSVFVHIGGHLENQQTRFIWGGGRDCRNHHGLWAGLDSSTTSTDERDGDCPPTANDEFGEESTAFLARTLGIDFNMIRIVS